eukprot:TRINITY_DN1731_c0_g1_i1.p1 TRINITY_DN1731_c0_g1~~TRINITY_DN1731_c0_g1_i1.p1  ORF type:complete len:167 (+),score=9.74 TRINITY_DN1731_c0_g1_i1:67-501(+)
MGKVTLTRRETLSACHRLHNPNISDEENRQIFGKCNNVNGHGHNYAIEVSVRGHIDPRTGMVMNLTDLKQAINRAILEPLDHKNIDKDVPYFRTHISTTENLAVFAWEELLKTLPDPGLLYEVKIWETDKNIISYRGQGSDSSP